MKALVLIFLAGSSATAQQLDATCKDTQQNTAGQIQTSVEHGLEKAGQTLDKVEKAVVMKSQELGIYDPMKNAWTSTVNFVTPYRDQASQYLADFAFSDSEMDKSIQDGSGPIVFKKELVSIATKDRPLSYIKLGECSATEIKSNRKKIEETYLPITVCQKIKVVEFLRGYQTSSSPTTGPTLLVDRPLRFVGLKNGPWPTRRTFRGRVGSSTKVACDVFRQQIALESKVFVKEENCK